MAKRTKRTNQRGRPPKSWKEVFVEKLSDAANVRAACEAAQVGRSAAYEHRRNDPVFAAAWDEALENAYDAMEAEIARRAFKGTTKPVYQGGRRVGEVQEFSDTLAMFMMKANRPEKYRDNYDLTRKLTNLLNGANQFMIPETDDRPEPNTEG